MLIGLPAQLLIMTGMIDGEFDAKEREEANKRLARAAVADPDPLYRELAAGMVQSGTTLESDVARARPERCRRILQDNPSPEEYQHFLMSVWADCLAVAAASTRGRRPLRQEAGPGERRGEGLPGRLGQLLWAVRSVLTPSRPVGGPSSMARTPASAVGEAPSTISGPRPGSPSVQKCLSP
ncbi:MAG: hypothetical protein ABIJ48_05745 [Actinomycetota bacterium]